MPLGILGWETSNFLADQLTLFQPHEIVSPKKTGFFPVKNISFFFTFFNDKSQLSKLQIKGLIIKNLLSTYLALEFKAFVRK